MRAGRAGICCPGPGRGQLHTKKVWLPKDYPVGRVGGGELAGLPGLGALLSLSLEGHCPGQPAGTGVNRCRVAKGGGRGDKHPAMD